MVTDLLIVTPGFPADEQDSSCIPPLQAFLLALRKSRPALNIAVIALQYPYTTRSYQWHGITVHPCGGRNRTWMKALTWRRAMNRFKRIHARAPVRAIHSLWLGEAAWLGQRMARECSARHVVTMMGQDARDGRRWWEMLKPGSTMIVLSEQHQRTYERSFSETPLVIPWGTDATFIGSGERSIDLLFCGSMIDVKRPLLFVEAVEKIRRARPVKGVMIGGGALSDVVQAAITERGLGDAISMRGQVSREEVLRTMRSARVLLHTSSYEGNAYVFSEALASGMSIVSFDVGGAKAMERWHIGSTVDELAAHAMELLQAPQPTEPLVLHPMTDTVQAYLTAYGII